VRNSKTVLVTSHSTVPITSLPPITDKNFSRALDAANEYINNLDYENARRIYNSCIVLTKNQTSKRIVISNQEKLMLDHIHTKLTLYVLLYKQFNSNNSVMDSSYLEKVLTLISHLDASLSLVETRFLDKEKYFIKWAKSYLKK
jgi:hypothetical protein